MKIKIKDRIKMCSLLLVFALLFWEIVGSPVISADYTGVLDESQPVEAAAYLTGTNFSVIEEACTPELLGNHASYISTSHIFYSRTFRSRNAFGKFLCTLILPLCLVGIKFVSSIDRYVYFQKETYLAMILSFIHDQDGKKRIRQ